MGCSNLVLHYSYFQITYFYAYFQAHTGGTLALVARVFDDHAARAESEALSRAILSFYERCIFHDLAPERLVETGAVKHTIVAMQTHAGSFALQRLATDVLNCECACALVLHSCRL